MDLNEYGVSLKNPFQNSDNYCKAGIFDFIPHKLCTWYFCNHYNGVKTVEKVN
jgi:hypothetical protein